jgi:hypothetical protein
VFRIIGKAEDVAAQLKKEGKSIAYDLYKKRKDLPAKHREL